MSHLIGANSESWDKKAMSNKRSMLWSVGSLRRQELIVSKRSVLRSAGSLRRQE